jgi:hypothetical protein
MKWQAKICLVRIFSMAIALCPLTLRPFTMFAQSPAKLWSIDLAENKDFQKRLSVSEVLLDAPSLNFLNNYQIICGFYDGEKGGYNLSMPPSGYHVLEINANNGTFGRELDFRVVDDHSRALPTEDGGFTVFSGRELTKFSSTFVHGDSYSTLRERVGDSKGRSLVDIAPSLQTILLYDFGPEGLQGQWRWISTKDFSVTKSVEGSRALMIQASDTEAILDGFGNRQLLNSSTATPMCTRCNAYFITNDLLFIDKEESYVIQTVNGERRGVGKLNIQASDFTRAAHATRIAFLTGRYQGGGFPLQTHFSVLRGSVIVLDWNTNRRVEEFNIAEPVGNPSAGFTQAALALSPDGKYLAILLHHTLSLYRLP